MFNLNALFNKQADINLKDRIADMLKTSPEKLAEFEAAYKASALDAEPEDFFEINSKQASEMARTGTLPEHYDESQVSLVIRRAVDELCAQTRRMAITSGNIQVTDLPALPGDVPLLTNADLNKIPVEIRPQCTGSLMRVDVTEMSSDVILPFVLQYQTAKNDKQRKQFYEMFRRGLDILDLDEITYAMLGMNQNSMSHWLPAVTRAVGFSELFQIPETKIAKVPMPILQMSRLDYSSLTPASLQIVDEWAMKAFDLDVNKTYFIKTGTYSSKYDFRNAKVSGEKEVLELGEYLLFIQNQAVTMAGPLAKPSFYGVSTTNEWVVREYIEDKENNPTIYKGMPLHTEYRVFVDFDEDKILGMCPYWEPETMKRRFSQMDDASSPHQRHDYIIYKMHEETLMKRYHDNEDKVLNAVRKMLPHVELTGQWSIDIMQNGDDFWLIDMATADTSALNWCVPQNLLKKTPENWLPALS